MRTVRRLRIVLGAGAMLCAVASVWPAAARAATRAGDAMIIDDVNRAPLGRGAKSTFFSVQLPAGASCRGDSANGGYHVQSYMVPTAVDPATLTFGSEGPLPTGTGVAFRQPLFATSSNPYAGVNTANATKQGGVGPIVNIPTMNFALFTPEQLPAGTYNVGIACTRGQPSAGQLDTYWNTRMTVASDLSWTAASASAPATPVPPAVSSVTTAAPAPTSGAVATATVSQAAASQTPASRTPASQTPASAVAEAAAPDNGAPSLNFPVADLLLQTSIHQSSRLSLAVLAVILLIGLRITYLLPRPTRLVPAVAV